MKFCIVFVFLEIIVYENFVEGKKKCNRNLSFKLIFFYRCCFIGNYNLLLDCVIIM